MLLIAGTDGLRAEWRAVTDVSLAIERGSALDFSHLDPAGPAGEKGRVIISAEGQLVFEQGQGERARFHCASLAWSPATGGFPDHRTADRYAEQLKRHGYNIARFHFVDALLMHGRAIDFDFDPDQLDRFHYLLTALKRNGVYWIMDVMTSMNGAIGGVYPHRWVETHNLKFDLHFDPAARRHWRRLAQTILARPNPYTGIPPLLDPALVLLVLANENGLQFLSFLDFARTRQAYPKALRPHFNAWLQRMYGRTSTLRQAWPDLTSSESLEDGTVGLPTEWHQRGPRMRDLKRFFRSAEKDTLEWMTREIRTLGYSGLVTNYNNITTTETHFSRRSLPVVALNGYFDEVISYDVGVSISQKSSLDDAAGYVRRLAGSRWLDRPFVITEYGQPFWNKFRREAGILFPSLAALQDWDFACRHAQGAIDLSFDQPWPHKRAILPYTIGLDPVARAGETLATLLLHRGDVAPARGRIAIPFGGEEDMLEDGTGEIPDTLTKLALISKIGLTPNTAPPSEARSSMTVARRRDPAPTTLRAVLCGRECDASAETFVRRLRRSGTLATANRTSLHKQLFESDTGEILLDAPRRLLQVVTQRTEAATFAQLNEPLRLGQTTIEHATGPALIAVSALDDRPISHSRRLLIILATDAANTGMSFRDAERRTIAEYGRMPVQIKREQVRIRLSFEQAAPAVLHSLHLNGAVAERLVKTSEKSVINLTLDNAAPGRPPTTYFLLERSFRDQGP